MDSSTGRIDHVLHPEARQIVFGEHIGDVEITDLHFISEIDHAHLVMLIESGLIDHNHAAALLRQIEILRAQRFEQLRGRIMPRGLYLAYEKYLIGQLGAQIGGRLHVGRSRNDLSATHAKLKARGPVVDLIRSGCNLMQLLITRADALKSATMPMYTHHQPALPSTLGHYLAGYAQSLARDLNGLVDSADELHCSPLGAGAGAGSTLAVNSARTAELLGFQRAAANSLDSVASRDWVLRLLAASAIAGVGISRLAADLLAWVGELGFLRLPDNLVGSSSAMPQKRNPFLLEHVQGRGSAPLGAFVAAAASMHAKPFTNCVAVGTEAVSHLWRALSDLAGALKMTQFVVEGFEVNERLMSDAANRGYITATEFANRLMNDASVDFRQAHCRVGELVGYAELNNITDLGHAAELNGDPAYTSVRGLRLNASEVAQASVFGGGPAAQTVERALELARDAHDAIHEQVNSWGARWNCASQSLASRVAHFAVREGDPVLRHHMTPSGGAS